MDQLWKEGVEMRTPRLGACGAFAGDALYIVGGWDGNQHDCTMEVPPFTTLKFPLCTTLPMSFDSLWFGALCGLMRYVV